MKIKVLPNVYGYVFIKEVNIASVNGLAYVHSGDANTARIGRIVSEGWRNGKFVLYLGMNTKRIFFANQHLLRISIHDIISEVEVEHPHEVVDVIDLNMEADCWDGTKHAHGEPSIMKL